MANALDRKLFQRAEDLLDIDKFREWVNNRTENDFIDKPGIPQNCPIANYLREEGGFSIVSVGGPTATLTEKNGDWDSGTLPYWVSTFVYQYDTLDPRYFGRDRAVKALEVTGRCMETLG